MTWAAVAAATVAAAGSIAGASMSNNGTKTTSGGTGTRDATTTTSGMDPEILKLLQDLVTNGTYSKDAAIKDSTDAVNNAIQTTMQQFMPTIGSASKGSGMMGDSMSQILATQLATQAAVQGAGVRMDSINSYGANFANMINAINNGTPKTTTEHEVKVEPKQTVSSSGGGCFITTAVCSGTGLPDNCEELEVLRNFRSTYMMQDEAHVALVRQYYSQAPKLCKVLDTLPVETQAQLYSSLLTLFIRPAVAAIKLGKLVEALDMYKLLFAYTKLLTLSIQSNQSGD